MLSIFNNLKPFFEDVYREISVREYARMQDISPPTASKLLNQFAKEELLIKKQDRIYLMFRANKTSDFFKDLTKAFWRKRLTKVLEPLREELMFKPITLFGSLFKVENTINSDVDLFIDLPEKKIDLSKAEKLLKREIQLFFKNAAKSEELIKNIKKGLII